MKLAIMQPYLFPYIGYFSLIENTDYFVFFDTPQYMRKGWINRNRILNAKGEAVYFTVPVEKAPRETPINRMKISNNFAWQEKIYGQLSVYKKRAPFFKNVTDLVRTVIEQEYQDVAKLAAASVIETCKYLGMDMKYDIFSGMQIPEFTVKEPDEWALGITKAMGYDTYINPPGGKSFFQREKYARNGIQLWFLQQELVEYRQLGNPFVPGLSIIDIMMFCKPDEIKKMMCAYTLEQ